MLHFPRPDINFQGYHTQSNPDGPGITSNPIGSPLDALVVRTLRALASFSVSSREMKAYAQAAIQSVWRPGFERNSIVKGSWTEG